MATLARSGVELAAYRAVGTLYNALMTALILGLITRRGEDTARDYVFRHFRRQHLEKFLPGLQKLGLAGEPDAPACALYHYHSNALGGVKTGYLRESDKKAWVRYPPPRIVVLEFPSFEKAEEFYHSDHYKPILAMRLKAGKSKAILVDGHAG